MTTNERSITRQRNPGLSGKAFRIFICLNLFLSLLSLAIPSYEAEAATIAVDTTDDELNNDGDCSLREAIQAANTNTAVDTCTAGTSGLDTINLPGLTFVLSITGSGEAANVTGDLDIIEDLVILGVSMNSTIIEGDTGWNDRLMDVANGVNLTLADLALRYGNIDGDGGGLRHLGEALDIDRVRINDNESTGNGGGLYIDAGGIAFLDDMYIHDNHCTGSGCDGGGIYAASPISAHTIEVYQNSAQDSGGALLGTAGSISFRYSSFRANQADRGGAISSEGTAELGVRQSEVSNNSAIVTPGGIGGGIYHSSSATVTLINSTVSGNQANSSGGGLWLGGDSHVSIGNATITDNEANVDSSGTDYGGGLYFNAAPDGVHVNNSIIAENFIAGVVNADHADCTNDGGTLDSSGYNLQGVKSTTMACNFEFDGDMQGSESPIDPLLGPLQDNDGPTYTHALLPGSPALEHGNPATPSGSWGPCEPSDQRLISRPQVTYCDIGAFEAEPNNPPNTPSNPDPVDAAVDVPIDAVLSWDGGDPDGHPVTYDVYFDADDPTPETLICDDVSSTTCDPGELDPNTTYYWSVEAYDGEYTSGGPTWSFTTSAPSVPPPVDFDGDLKTDPAKFSASTGTLSYFESSTSTWQDVDMGTGTYDYVSRSDFDGDGKTDPAKFVTAAGALWYLESSSSTWQGIYMGPGSYQLVTGSDFDGDGQTDPALFITDGGANALWYLESSSTTWQGIYMGPGSYELVEGSDFDGDGATDPALFYSEGGANALWYLESGTSTWQGAYMGPGTYEMVPASDFDGDGESDPALFDSTSASLWYLQSSTSTWAGQYMGTGTYDYVAASDFDGDGATDPAEFVPGTDMLWWIRSSDSVWDGVWMGSGSYEIVN